MSAKALLLIGAAALLPALAGQVAAQSVPAPGEAFVAPESPVVLTRTVWRTLADGKQIVVKRRYALRFTRKGDGYQVDGRFLDAAVEAPPMLSAMAELERRRGDEGLFPLQLDGAGRIRSEPAPKSDAARGDAAKRGQGLLATTPLAKAQKQESGSFLSQVAAQGALAAWPADLFNPVKGERSERRKIALPGGQEGEVAVSIKALDAGPGTLHRAVERTVTTVMAGTSRTSREQWTIAPIEYPVF